MQVRKKDGMLINDLGQEVHCGNHAQYCGLRCAMFEVRVDPYGKKEAILHCCKRAIRLREVKE